METMCICLKESAQSKEEIRRLLKRLHALLWMKLQERRWESKPLLLQLLVDIKVQVQSNS